MGDETLIKGTSPQGIAPAEEPERSLGGGTIPNARYISHARGLRPYLAPGAGLETPQDARALGLSAEDRASLSSEVAALPKVALARRSATSPSSRSMRARSEGRGGQEPDLEVRGQLGRGGMGVVERAWQASLRREVAIKTPREVTGLGGEDALLREARITGRLEHPNITPVHALSQDERGRPVMVMKRIEGVSWAELIAQPDHPWWRRLAPSGDGEEASARLVEHLQILTRVCDAVAFAHSHGVIHRDIKPDNVMVGRFGEVLLVDWGLALMLDEVDPARQGEGMVGTVEYMAPEMVCGSWAKHDARTDIYQLGGTLYTVLTGSAPHAGDAPLMVKLQQIYDGYPLVWPPHVPEPLRRLCELAMQCDPDARIDTAERIKAEIQTYLRHRGSILAAQDALAELCLLEAALGAEARACRARADDRDDPEAMSNHEDAQRVAAEAVGQTWQSAQFGLMTALRQWPGNMEAREGLQRGLVAMARYELRSARPNAARRYVARLPTPDPALVREVADAIAAQEAIQDATHHALKVAREVDLSIDPAPRERFVALVLVAPVALAVLAQLPGDIGLLDSSLELMTLSKLLLGLFCVAALAMRRALSSSAINRRLTGIAGLLLGSMWANRLIGWYDNAPLASILKHDLMLMAALMLACAVLLHRYFVFGGITAMLGVVLLALTPLPSLPLFGVFKALVSLAFLLALVVAARRPNHSGSMRLAAILDAPRRGGRSEPPLHDA